MDLELGKGIFLVATPQLRDPNFRQTVVLLCEHGAEGALGVVVNRPTAMSISEALPQVPIIEGAGHVLLLVVDGVEVEVLVRAGGKACKEIDPPAWPHDPRCQVGKVG